MSAPCDDCRSRKRKCYHTPRCTDAIQRPQHSGGVNRQPSRDSSQQPYEAFPTRELSPSSGTIGEYNPESVLEDLSSVPSATPSHAELPASRQTHGKPARALARHPEDQAAFIEQRSQRQMLWHEAFKRRPQPQLSEKHRAYLEEAGAFLELPRTTTDALLPIYLSALDDIIPIVDGSAVFRDHSNGQSSRYLVMAMCLVACKTKQAAPFLRPSEGDPVMHPLKFASKLLDGLDAAIKADLIPERLIRIQILALMHLDNNGVLGKQRSATYLSQAICEAWTLTLHWDLPGNPDQDQCDHLWWTLRNLDRLNKPVMGVTPFMIDDSDISIQRIGYSKDNYRSQLMRVSLALGDLMSRATKVYKASSTDMQDHNEQFPTLEEVTYGLDFGRFHRSHREYLAIWYHVAAMLSCRYSGPGSVQYERRLCSADRILDIMVQEGREDPLPLPLVPYAMSISTCVIYRALRDEARDSSAAYRDLERCCAVLESLSHRWTSTKGVCKLAKRLCSIPIADTTGRLRSRQYRKWPKTTSKEVPRSSDTLALIPNEPWAARPTTIEGRAHSSIPGVTGSGWIPHGRAADVYQDIEQQNLGINGDMDGSFSRLDIEFSDVFNYNLPYAFRNPSTWGHIRWDDEEGLGGLP